MKAAWLVVLVAGCGAEAPQPIVPARVLPPDFPADAGTADAAADAGDAGSDASPADAPQGVPLDAALPAVAPIDLGPEVWLKGSTHVHAKPSGDSAEPVSSVIRWYEQRGYDFIALTDHNRVSEVDGSTKGQVAVRAPAQGLIVLSGVELTFNPTGCEPPGEDSGKCRIHLNALGVTERPEGKLEWANRTTKLRTEMYAAGFAQSKVLGAHVIQINHPNWYWGMTPDVLAELAKHAPLVEIANVQFETWNAGDKDHLSLEAQWDVVLQRGGTLWGVASDDAHDYDDLLKGKYPPGGGWVVVKSRRDPRAILDALATGRFYSSTGVTLSRAEPDGDELVVEVTADKRKHTIAFIENGKTVATVKGLTARRSIPKNGYLRAVVTRDDGKKAWVQPVRR